MVNQTISAAAQRQPVPVDDQLRGLGALVDIAISVTFFVLAIFAIVTVNSNSGLVALGLLIGFWIVDIVVYAGVVAAFEGSIGNLLTSRRVIDAATGGRVSFWRAVRRYFARRRLLRALLDLHERNAPQSSEGIFGPEYNQTMNPMAPIGFAVAAIVVSAMNGSKGPNASVADRSAGSVVVRARRS